MTLKRKKELSYVLIAICYIWLLADGGWERMVALVGLGVCLLVGLILWVAKKTLPKDSNSPPSKSASDPL